jgi:hypothetical protein
MPAPNQPFHPVHCALDYNKLNQTGLDKYNISSLNEAIDPIDNLNASTIDTAVDAVTDPAIDPAIDPAVDLEIDPSLNPAINPSLELYASESLPNTVNSTILTNNTQNQ